MKKDEAIYKASINVSGTKLYKEVYLRMQDSIKIWCKNNLEPSLELITYPYLIDSLLCFNQTKTKVIAAILVTCDKKDCLQDDIKTLNGVEINGKWNFFYGPTIVLQREAYQKNVHVPLSYEKMYEIALKEVYTGYLNEKQEINESFFSDLTSGAWCTDCKTQEDWDNAYLKWVRYNWEGRDTTKPILQLP